jgi:hypothetical protein
LGGMSAAIAMVLSPRPNVVIIVRTTGTCPDQAFARVA